MGFREVIVDDIRRGSTFDAGNFEIVRHETGEAQGRITGSVFLVIGAFVRLVDDD